MNKDFSEELSKLPDKPGVYIMHDIHDTIIYVGKASSLKNRVRQYFRASHNEGIRKKKMVENIERFEYIITDSELEALVLECNLIKKHRPKYNVLLRDDKTYPFIKITTNEDYPRILFTRELKNDNAKYFGPFTAEGAVKETVCFLQKVYKLRDCNKSIKEGEKEGKRVCLNYHINQCLGPCQGNVDKKIYMENVSKAIDFLKGNHEETFDILINKMNEASDNLEFERAAEYRDLIESIKKCLQKQKITSVDNDDADVLSIYGDDDVVVCILFIRDGKLIGRDSFYIRNQNEESKEDLLSAFIMQFYNGAIFVPKEIIIDRELDDAILLEEYLNDINKNSYVAKDEDVAIENLGVNYKMRRINIVVPRIGKKKQIVEMAKKNARLAYDNDREKFKREEARTIGALKEISKFLGGVKVDRIEAYDISNTSGFNSVGSMVVFEKGKPKYNDYRKFKIKTIEGPNDYASMEEVLIRRFKRGLEEKESKESSFSNFPDIIMMDGGKGQVKIALSVLGRMGLDITVCGMVKDNYHNTRGIIFNDQEIEIDKDSEAFKLITRIQDEAHRFAISYHKNLRDKGMVHSRLDDIEGIGPKRRKALMKKYIDLEAIKEATIEELSEVESMDAKSARAVYDYFHK